MQKCDVPPRSAEVRRRTPNPCAALEKCSGEACFSPARASSKARDASPCTCAVRRWPDVQQTHIGAIQSFDPAIFWPLPRVVSRNEHAAGTREAHDHHISFREKALRRFGRASENTLRGGTPAASSLVKLPPSGMVGEFTLRRVRARLSSPITTLSTQGEERMSGKRT